MAIYYARKSGNVNAADVWATTPTGVASDVFSLFTNQDTLVSNSFTITLNVNTTVLEVRNDNTGGATAGGSFALSNSAILSANIYSGTASNCVVFSISGSATIIGNIYGTSASASSVTTMTHSGSGILNIIGNLIGGQSNFNSVISLSSIGTLNITGNIINVAGNNSVTLGVNGNGIVNITGNITGGSGSVSAALALSSIAGVVNITGLVVGGPGSTAYGVQNNSGGTINIVGTAIGGSNSIGAINSSTGTLIVKRAKGNSFGPGSVGVTSQVGVSASQNGSTKVYEIEYGSLGQSPTSGPIELVTDNSNVAVFATRLGLPKTLVDLNNLVNLIPNSANVRSGISYNYGNNIGTCVIPNANSVVYGVSVDNTIGSGLLSPVAVWNALTNAIGTAGSIGERLKNVSTVSTVGKQLEGVL